LFPTRYALELEGLKGVVSSDTFKEPSQREDAKKSIKKLLEERYTSGKNKWFFTALRVSGSVVSYFALLKCCILVLSLLSRYVCALKKILYAFMRHVIALHQTSTCTL
jgi:large subunit ribosomal protein L27e